MSVNNGGSEEEIKEDSKRPLTKFTTGDKKFPVSFDKNLTVEKARFDLNPGSSHPTDEPNPPLTTSVTLPVVTPTPVIQTIPSQSTPLLTKSTKPKEERRNVKRKKHPVMSGTATPSEVFHRNLVDAVSNVEDSDENEQYVYPYSNDPPDPIQRTTSSNLYRPQSTRSCVTPETKKTSTSFLSDVFRPITSSTKPSKSREEFRPKLRSYVMDHQTKLTDWIDGKQSPPHNPSRRPSHRPAYYGIGETGSYTTDDEEAQHTPVRRRSLVHISRHRKQKATCTRYMMNMVLCMIIGFLCFISLIMYFTTPLKDLDVNMGRVLSSDKELIFDLHIRAFNGNLWTIHIADSDISVFAFSQVVPFQAKGVDPAEYLGGFYHFDEPLSFPTSFYTHKYVNAISQIRIKSPGADKSGNERWSRIIRYPYGLVVRGVLKYKPLLSFYPQSIAICNVVRVDPTTGKVFEDPDQTYCLNFNNHTVSTTES